MRKTQLVEIDLRSGIVSNDSPYAIGPRLRRATNTVWGYRYPRTGDGSDTWIHRMPLTFPYQAGVAYTGAGLEFYDIGFRRHGATNIVVMGRLAGAGARAYTVWPSTGGAALAFHASVTTPFTIPTTSTRGCSVYWPTPGTHPQGGATTGTVALVYDDTPKTITRPSGSFLDDGFAVGDTITVSESTSNNGTFTLTAVTATVLTVAETITDESADTSRVTLAVDLPTTGALIFSHPYPNQGGVVSPLTPGNHLYYLLDTDTTIRSFSTAPEWPTLNVVTALAVHLDRLWVATTPNTASTEFKSRSEVYYTDPLDLGQIRSTSVIPFDGVVQDLLPGQFGAIDHTGIPHLVVGTDVGIHVIDGDPSLGTFAVRTLTTGLGMLSGVTTPFGVFLLGTDGNLHVIPPGMTEIRPVGDPILDVLAGNAYTGTVDILGTRDLSALAWFEPYLYLYPGGNASAAYIAEPSRDSIRFWGPVTPDTGSFGFSFEAIIRQPPPGVAYAPSGTLGRHPVYALQHQPPTNPILVAFDEATAQAGTYPNGSNVARTASIMTGVINVPGHRVQIARIILETRMNATWTVTVADEIGRTVTAVRAPGTELSAGAPDEMMTQHFSVPAMALARGCSITVSAAATGNLRLVRLLAEIHTSPAQF